MKKFILFLLLIVILSVGALAFLLRNDFHKITESREEFAFTLRDRVDEAVFTYAPRSVRLFLFKNMPGIFPVVMVCEHRQPSGDSDSVFSGDIGDLIEARGKNLTVFCPKGIEINLFPGSRARLLPRGGKPGIQLIQGRINLTLRDSPLVVHSDLFSVTLTGQPDGNRINLASGHDGFSIGCLNGRVKGKIEATPAAEGKKNYLLSRDCLLSLKWSRTLPEKHLMPGDSLAYADLSKERKEWAAQDQSSRLAELGVDVAANPAIIAGIDPVPSPGGTVKFRWQSAAPQGTYNCTLYTQSDDRSPVQAAHRFQGSAAAGELTLLQGFLKFWMSISCNNGVQSYTSNVLAPLQ